MKPSYSLEGLSVMEKAAAKLSCYEPSGRVSVANHTSHVEDEGLAAWSNQGQ